MLKHSPNYSPDMYDAAVTVVADLLEDGEEVHLRHFAGMSRMSKRGYEGYKNLLFVVPSEKRTVDCCECGKRQDMALMVHRRGEDWRHTLYWFHTKPLPLLKSVVFGSFLCLACDVARRGEDAGAVGLDL